VEAIITNTDKYMSILSEYFKKTVSPSTPMFNRNSPTAHTTPMFSSRMSTDEPVITPSPVAPVAPVVPTPVFGGGAKAPVPNVGPSIDPKLWNPNGSLYSPDEYANNMANNLKGTTNKNYDVPQYTEDNFTEVNPTEQDLTDRATKLNNTRNDIATGTTDPYGIITNKNFAFTPEELTAIQKAYAGIYDPALTHAIGKLEAKQKYEQAKQKEEEDRAMEVFKTNENIRQWQATTGTNDGSTGNPTRAELRNQKEIQDEADYLEWIHLPGNENLTDKEKADFLRKAGLDPLQAKYGLNLLY